MQGVLSTAIVTSIMDGNTAMYNTRSGILSYHKGKGSENGVGRCEYACSDPVGVSEYREAVIRYT